MYRKGRISPLRNTRSVIRNLRSGHTAGRRSILSDVNNPPDKPSRSAALEDELAALELLLEDAKRKRLRAEREDASGTDGDEPETDADTSPGGE